MSRLSMYASSVALSGETNLSGYGPRHVLSGRTLWAKRQLEVSIWETRCRKAMLQVYRDRVEEMGRWALDTLQRKLNKRILLQQQWDWDGGWLQH